MSESYLLRNRRILIVEDECLVAYELERALRRCGANVAGPVGTLDGALGEIVSGSGIDAVVLDLRLHDEETFQLADGLRATGIPFIFASGYDGSVVPERHQSVVRFEKPCDLNRLTTTVADQLD